jgi:6,7-dimethyl-8-ribityllumazine synthase
MSTKNNKFSGPNMLPTGFGRELKVGIVVAEWNPVITDALYKGATETLTKYGAEFKTLKVPGTFELTYGATEFVYGEDYNAVIVLGCVIRGETPHFDYVCQSVTQGLTALNLDLEIPVIFGVLTTENQQQALDRAGGKYGNKGEECAIAAIKMAKLEVE